MKMNQIWIGCAMALTLSSSAVAHPNHNWEGKWGYLGLAFNAVEFGKHGVVIYDQAKVGFKEGADNMDLKLLVGNAASLAVHAINGKAFLDSIRKKNTDARYMLPLLLLSYVPTAADMYVDGITSWEYWTDWSIKNVAIVSTSLTCLGLNSAYVYGKVFKAKKN